MHRALSCIALCHVCRVARGHSRCPMQPLGLMGAERPQPQLPAASPSECVANAGRRTSAALPPFESRPPLRLLPPEVAAGLLGPGCCHPAPLLAHWCAGTHSSSSSSAPRFLRKRRAGAFLAAAAGASPSGPAAGAAAAFWPRVRRVVRRGMTCRRGRGDLIWWEQGGRI